jgi:outer membrane protein assembly factor BamD (BamD/ComL family)
VALLWVLGILLWITSAAAVVTLPFLVPKETPGAYWLAVGVGIVINLLAGGVSIGLAILVKYAFSAAVSAKLMERVLRDCLQKAEGAASPSEPATASHEEVVSLLSEIMENTLLDESDKAAKRQLAKKHRQQALRREIEAQIKAGKYREAHERLEEFRVRYADSTEIHGMETQLSEALRAHEHTEISHVTEQVQRYMGLGLWERAIEMARALAEQFPENPEASRLPETVRVEQEANRRQEQQRLYREIEHLVSRKHWRQALRTAETLFEQHGDSPEAHALAEQMEELRRNAAISERKEWESRITEHIQTGRHREAYALAVDLMEKYPDSPQAEDIRKRLDQLKSRAGITE